MSIQYVVIAIEGDYAILRTAEGVENRVAMALLPEELDIGMQILFENFEYTVL